jgi:antitoxin VapB
MPLSIRNPEAERLARQVAQRTGESITEAIERSLEERLQRLQRSGRNRILAEQVQEILNRFDLLPTVDARSEEEILGYDENGMPR